MKNFLKNLNYGKLKRIAILFNLFLLYIFIYAYSYVYSVSSNLSDNVFRLHVIANSDSQEDQLLKYKVRDNLINYMNTICADCTSKQEVINISKENINTFKTIAEETIVSEGFNYTVNVEIGNFSFPTKTYGDISFPSGYYDALKIKIGEASGQNWWCMLYPSLCFVDMTSGIVPDESKDNLKTSLSEEEYNLISDSDNEYFNFKFKIIEFFNNNTLITAKK